MDGQESPAPSFHHDDHYTSITGFWSAGNEGMERKMQLTIMGYIGPTIRIHSFIPSQPKIR